MAKLTLISAVFCGIFAVSGCTFSTPGRDPIEGEFNYPAEIELSPATGSAAKYVIVANANFDLRYNTGQLLSLDAARIGAAARACPSPQLPTKLPCTLDPKDYKVSEVRTGSFPGGLTLSTSGDRIYMPTRSDGDLSFIDLHADGTLHCGDENASIPTCDDTHRHTDHSLISSRTVLQANGSTLAVTEPGDAVSVVSAKYGSTNGDYILVPDRTGIVSLFVDARVSPTDAPVLVDVLGSFPPGLASIALDPATGLAYLPNTSTPGIGRVGVAFDDAPGGLASTRLFNAGTIALRGVNDGSDTRDMRFLPNSRDVLIAARKPRALIYSNVGESESVAPTLPISSLVGVGFGPSRLQVAELGGRVYAFLSCYDAKVVYVLDVANNDIVATVRSISGPFDMAVDAEQSLLYVVDFRGSRIHLVDISALTNPVANAAAPITTIAYLGALRLPVGTK